MTKKCLWIIQKGIDHISMEGWCELFNPVIKYVFLQFILVIFVFIHKGILQRMLINNEQKEVANGHKKNN